MTPLSVPPVFRGALAALARIDERDAESLIRELSECPPFKAVAELQALAGEAVPDGYREDAESLVPALLTLSTLSRTNPLTAGTTAIADAASLSADLEVDDDARQALRARLERLLNATAIYTTAAAVDLLTQHPRNYGVSRVVTDMRPVFAQDVEERPSGAVLVHTLQLQTWNRDGRTETLYVAMDEADLRELQRTVGRALDKTNTLVQLLVDQRISYFQLDERTT